MTIPQLARLPRRAALATGVLAALLALALPAVATASTTPVWKLRSYREPGRDRSFKCDLVEEAPLAPKVVIYGGSRCLRLEPKRVQLRTGLNGFNAAFHNGRPEDAWAFTNFLLDLHPRTHLRCVWGVQVTTFVDHPMHQGLLVDPRLSTYFPADLVAQQLKGRHIKTGNLLGTRRYSADGVILRNGYDRHIAEGRTLDQAITEYLDPAMLAAAGSGKLPKNTRAMHYFEQTIALLNEHDVKPLIVVMPYHPRVLSAFLAVGWGRKQQWLLDYLHGLQSKYQLHVLNCTSITTFGGKPQWFYDGSHLMEQNGRLLLDHCVRAAPDCFKLWKDSVDPPPAPPLGDLPATGPAIDPATGQPFPAWVTQP